MFAAQVAIQITGAATQAGSPDNFDLAIVQETGVPAGQQPGGSSSGINIQQINGAALSNGNAFAQSGVAQTLGDAVNNNQVEPSSFGGNQLFAPIFPLVFNGTTWDRTRGTAGTGTSAAPAIQVVSDGLGQAFSSTFNVTNPAINAVIGHVNANSGSRSLYFDRLIITTSVSANFNINVTSSIGTTCSAGGNVINQKLGSGIASTGVSNFSCTTNPTQVNSVFLNINTIANTPLTVDLRGFIASNATTNGIDVLMLTALTGITDVVFFWYEK